MLKKLFLLFVVITNLSAMEITPKDGSAYASATSDTKREISDFAPADAQGFGGHGKASPDREDPSNFAFWSQLPREIKQEILINAYGWKFDIDNPDTILESYKTYIKELKKCINKEYSVSLLQAFNNFLRTNLRTKEDVTKLSEFILNELTILKKYITGFEIHVRNWRHDTRNTLLSFFKLLLKLNKFEVNARINLGISDFSALLWAILESRTDIVKLLIDNGANVNEKNNFRDTALIYASFSNQQESLELLIEKNADINAINQLGNTALIVASMRGYRDMAKLLIDKGANVHIRNNNGKSALEVAANKDIVNLIKAKIEQEREQESSRTTPRSCSVM